MSTELDRFNRLHLQHKSRPGTKAPQKQCKDKRRHPGHHYEHKRTGLIWWCQGRTR